MSEPTCDAGGRLQHATWLAKCTRGTVMNVYLEGDDILLGFCQEHADFIHEVAGDVMRPAGVSRQEMN